MVNDCFVRIVSVRYILLSITALAGAVVRFRIKPTTGIEPVNLILTKDVLYQLSYMGAK